MNARLAFPAMLAVAVLGCGGGGNRSPEERLREEGGLVVRYTAAEKPSDPAALGATARMLRRRTKELDGAAVKRMPGGLAVLLPGASEVDADVLPPRLSGLAVYDWEPNVIGPSGKPDPTNPAVGGGVQAGSPVASLTLYEAVRRAEGRPEAKDDDNAWPASVFYWVDAEAKRALGPFGSRREAERVPHRSGSEIVEIAQGTTLVRAEQPATVAGSEKGDEWFVLRDEVALDGRAIRNPAQSFDQAPGGNGGPIVTFGFTDRGRRAWRRLTRRVARRGASQQLPGTAPQDAAQHFAVVVDDQLISVPFVDHVQNPDGVSADNGSQIGGGLTIESAQRLATILAAGPVPVPLRRTGVEEIPPGG